MRGTVVRRPIGATKHGNENRKYELLSPAHAAAGGALWASIKEHKVAIKTYNPKMIINT